MDIPNLCAKATAHSDLNSDLDCSDVDFDSDSQNKATAQDADEKSATQKRDEACEKLKKLFFARVSTDSTETDCSSIIDFKPQTTAGESNSPVTDNNKSDATMECDSSKKSDGFCIVQNLVSSTDDIEVANEKHSTFNNDNDNRHKSMDVIGTCVPNNDCVTDSMSVADVVDTNITLATDSTENST